MRDARAKLANRLYPLGVAQFSFKLSLLRHVLHGNDAILQFTIVATDGRVMDACREDRAVLTNTIDFLVVIPTAGGGGF